METARKEKWKTVTKFFNELSSALNVSGYAAISLKVAQVEALESIYDKRDTVVVLPTGYGKSIIFHIAP